MSGDISKTIAESFMEKHENSLVIGLTGPIASGKTTIAEIISEYFGFKVVSCGETVKQLVERKLTPKIHPVVDEIYRLLDGYGIPPTENPPRELMLRAGDLIRAYFDHTLVIALTVAQANADKIVVDGVRGPAEIQFIQKRLHGLVIYVDAPINERYQRVLARKSPKDTGIITSGKFLDFLKVDSKEETKFHHNSLGRKLADLVINNRDEQYLTRFLTLLEFLRRRGQ